MYEVLAGDGSMWLVNLNIPSFSKYLNFCISQGCPEKQPMGEGRRGGREGETFVREGIQKKRVLAGLN